MSIVIDESECVGCESCVSVCPEVFEMNDDGDKAQVINAESTEACVEEAINVCPVSCISQE